MKGIPLFSWLLQKRERRRVPRIRISRVPELTFWDEEGKRHFGEIIDLSLYGLRFASKVKIRAHSKIDLEFQLLTETGALYNIRTDAEAVYCYKPMSHERHRVGCSFLNMEKASCEKLAGYLKRIPAKRRRK